MFLTAARVKNKIYQNRLGFSSMILICGQVKFEIYILKTLLVPSYLADSGHQSSKLLLIIILIKILHNLSVKKILYALARYLINIKSRKFHVMNYLLPKNLFIRFHGLCSFAVT